MPTYRFKEDYHFDNDIYGARELGAEVLQWWAKKGDEVKGEPEKDAYVALIGGEITPLYPEGIHDKCAVEASVLEKISD